ncbi:hypothetical protein DAPPUDRAFT_111590 [Daphnia pulex]|uniref:Uncharacterized protein n=1 Tax=Daphnia pulex TaxID=6669 RepID=E9H9R2_DAPPU|nr:hypothetical protein DAPPUDRAFT_111590 [Daphnia pulex]|eukprot:EFX71445.1 hypothetical protein DAPPUDRAFT_111590 [Daphnia pulex]
MSTQLLIFWTSAIIAAFARLLHVIEESSYLLGFRLIWRNKSHIPVFIHAVTYKCFCIMHIWVYLLHQMEAVWEVKFIHAVNDWCFCIRHILSEQFNCRPPAHGIGCHNVDDWSVFPGPVSDLPVLFMVYLNGRLKICQVPFLFINPMNNTGELSVTLAIFMGRLYSYSLSEIQTSMKNLGSKPAIQFKL